MKPSVSSSRRSSSSSSSASFSSPAVSPSSGRRCLRKSSSKKQQHQRKQTLDMLRQMIGCDKNVSALELIQLIMDHISRLRDVLETENFDQNQSSSDSESVQTLLRQLSLSSYQITTKSKSA